MIPRLSPEADARLLAILRSAASGPFDKRQACLDCAGVVARLPAAIEHWKSRPGRGRHDRVSAVRVLAYLAADTYWKHTGRGPGYAENETGWEGGRFPAFVGALADSANVAYDKHSLVGHCRETRKALSIAAGVTKHTPSETRAAQRAELLDTHVAFVDEDGNAVMGGYEPAPDDAAFDAADTFKHFTRRP